MTFGIESGRTCAGGGRERIIERPMALRAVVGLRIGSAEAGREAAERLKALKGVTVRGVILSEREGVAAALIAADDLRALRAAVKEVERVEKVKGAIILMADEDLWAELAKMGGEEVRSRYPSQSSEGGAKGWP